MKTSGPGSGDTAAIAATLRQRLEDRSAIVGVIGLGYVGLPLAVELARAGFRTIGIDIDPRKADAINRGESYIQDVPTERLATLVAAGRLSATTDFTVVQRLDTVNICVPTPLRKTKDPDLSFVVAALQSVQTHLHTGLLVILESTTYPGTTNEVVQPLLEQTGLKAGRDFFLAFSPERVDPGNEKWTTRNVPKVVGGLTPTCTALATTLYSASIDHVVPVTSPKVAEMVKLLENTFRAVNIGLINELALMCDRLGVSVWEVVEAAATKPFGFMPFFPGPGLGGHCIPIDPFYLSWKAKEVGFEARFIELAGHVNGAMPLHVVDKVTDALNSQRKAVHGSRILVLGLAYKRDIDDLRESPALDVMALLQHKGATLSYHDPFIPSLPAAAWPGGFDMTSVELTPAALAAADCTVVITDHSAFDVEAIGRHAPLIVDSRNAIKTALEHVFRLGDGRRSSALQQAAETSSR